MKKTKLHLIDGNGFVPDGIVVLQSRKSVEDLIELIKKYNLTHEELEQIRDYYNRNCDANGFTLTGMSGGRFLVVVFSGGFATLSHEMLHAVERVCEHRGIPISKDTEEVRCMLLGYFMRQIV